MTPEQFCYWLQGFAEITPAAPDWAQWTIIRDHLQTVFKKETPDREEDLSKSRLLLEEIRRATPGTGRIC